jgi:hypothetical protein
MIIRSLKYIGVFSESIGIHVAFKDALPEEPVQAYIAASVAMEELYAPPNHFMARSSV